MREDLSTADQCILHLSETKGRSPYVQCVLNECDGDLFLALHCTELVGIEQLFKILVRHAVARKCLAVLLHLDNLVNPLD